LIENVVEENTKYNTFESTYKSKPVNNDLNLTNSTQFATDLKQTEQKPKSLAETFDEKKKLDFESTQNENKTEIKRSQTPETIKREKPQPTTYQELIKEKLALSYDFNTWDLFKLLNQDNKTTITSVDIQKGLEQLKVYRSLYEIDQWILNNTNRYDLT